MLLQKRGPTARKIGARRFSDGPACHLPNGKSAEWNSSNKSDRTRQLWHNYSSRTLWHLKCQQCDWHIHRTRAKLKPKRVRDANTGCINAEAHQGLKYIKTRLKRSLLYPSFLWFSRHHGTEIDVNVMLHAVCHGSCFALQMCIQPSFNCACCI